ncbi:hypothetical protein OROGR_014031 [Orobanche gracilis]
MFDIPSNVVQKKRVARILFLKIRPSQKILKIRDVTPLEAEDILTYIKSPRNGSVSHFFSKFDVNSNVVQKKRVARILFFKIRPSQEILKIRDDTPLNAEEIFTYIKKPSKRIGWHFSSKFDVPSNVVQKKRVARILFFKIRPSQKILKIRDVTPLEAEDILTYQKKPSKRIGLFDIPSNVVQKKRVARILFLKIRPSQKILKIRDVTPLEAEDILTYIKSPRNGSVSHFFSKFDVNSNVVQKKRVARILFFKIRPSQEILKIRDDTPLNAEEIFTYIKKPSKRTGWHFSSKFDVPSNVVQKKRVARILFFKIRPSQKILKIRDVTPLEAEDILTYQKKTSKRIDNVVQKKRVARILFLKIRPSQKILKIRDVTPLEAEDVWTYIKSPRNGSVSHFFSKFDVNSNVVQKKRVARILFFKIRPSQEILKIRDDTPLKAEEIFTYIKKPSKRIGWHFSSKFDVPSNVVHKKRVARILFFKIRPSQKILKIRDVTPLEAEDILTYKKKPSKRIDKFDIPSNVVQKKRVARILFLKIRPSQKILKIRDVTPLEAEDILTYIKSPRNGSVSHFFSKFDVNSNVVQKKRVARILFFKIRPSQEILKIRDDTPLKAEEIFTYIKKPSKRIGWHFSSKFDVPSNVVQKKRVARILFFKIRPSQKILKIRDVTPLEAEDILTYQKKTSKRIGLFDIPSNVVQKKRVARILFLKIRPSQKILKIRDVTPLEAEDVWTYIKSPRNGSVSHFFSKFDVNSNVVQKKRVARILFFKIRPSQEILKIRDDTPLKAEEIFTYIKKPSKRIGWHFSSKFDVPSNVVHKKRVARILFFKIRPSQKILKIRDVTPLEAEDILTYKKKTSKRIDKFDIPSNVVQKKRVARILFLKIRPSQKILKIRDVTPLEAEDILTYIKSPRNGSVSHFFSKFDVNSNVVQKKRVARILFFKIRPSQEILKIRDDTPLKAEEIFTYIKKPSKRIGWHFSSKFDVPSNVVQKKRVARILFFKIRPSQKILKIRDVTPLEAEDILTYQKKTSKRIDNVVQKKRVARILFLKIRPSQKILKIRDVTPLEAEDVWTYIKSPRNGSVSHFFSKFDVNSNVVQKKRVARILFFKIRPSQEILKIRDDTPLKAEEIFTYIKKPSKRIGWHFSSKFDVPSNVVHKKRVARILFFKIRPSQKILKIRDVTPLEAEDILTYKKKPSKRIDKFDIPSNVVQKKRVARILFLKIRPSQKILKIRDVTPLEAEDILTYIKSPRNGSVSHFFSKFDVNSNVVQKKRVARILFFKIRPSQEILKIRDDTPLKAEEIFTYIKKPSKRIGWHFSSKFDVPSNVVQKKRVARILFFKIRPSQKILKIRDVTPLEAEDILTYQKKTSKRIEILKIHDGTHLEFDIPSNVVQKKRVARILFLKIRPSQKILKIRDVTPLEAEDVWTYIKSPRNGSVSHFFSKFDVNSNVVQKKRVARILFFKIRPSQEILKIRDDTPLKAEEIFTYIKKPSKRIGWHFSSKFDVPSNVVHKKRVARILFFKIRPSQKILKIRDVTPLEAEDILTYKKKPSKRIESSQKILKIRDVTPLEAEDILTYIKSPRNGSSGTDSIFQNKAISRNSKIHDDTPLKAEEIFTYIKKPSKRIGWHFSSKFDVPYNVVQKKRVARILFFKIRPSQKILKIRDVTPLEAEDILTYKKNPRNGSVWHFSSKFDVPSNVVQKKRVAQIMFFKIRPSQEILKIHDGTHLEVEEILTYVKNKFDIPSNVVQKKRVAQILFLKIRPSQKILKIRDVTPLEAEDILTYIKSPRNGSVSHFFSKFDVNSNVVQKKRVARILFFKIRPSQEILKIRDDTPLKAEEIFTYIKKPSKRIGWHFSSKFDVPSNVVQKKRVARILFFKIRPSQKILKIRDVTPLEAEDILTYQKKPRNGSVWHFSSKFDVPSNVVQKKRVAQIMFFKIRPSQEILKIHDGTHLKVEEILTYVKKFSK